MTIYKSVNQSIKVNTTMQIVTDDDNDNDKININIQNNTLNILIKDTGTHLIKYKLLDGFKTMSLSTSPRGPGPDQLYRNNVIFEKSFIVNVLPLPTLYIKNNILLFNKKNIIINYGVKGFLNNYSVKIIKKNNCVVWNTDNNIYIKNLLLGHNYFNIIVTDDIYTINRLIHVYNKDKKAKIDKKDNIDKKDKTEKTGTRSKTDQIIFY